MEWQAIDRAAEERKQREIDAKQAYDEEIQRILDIALERDRPRVTRL
jgi:hypothetical protein